MAGPLVNVLRGDLPSRRPIWLMRQAGRYLPEYRALRQQAGSFLDLCYAPKLACEVTLQPLKRFDFDAAILFSDILVVPHGMGLDLAFVENEGPRLQTVRSMEDVKKLDVSGRSKYFDLVAETVVEVSRELGPDKTLIGFCGAPWTVASYMIEGGSSKRELARDIALASPAWFELLMDKLIDVSVSYLLLQIRAGAEVVQIFDSWAGDLGESQRERWVTGPIAIIVARIRDVFPGFPVIVFARGIGQGHAQLAEDAGANAISVEQNVDLGVILRQLPESVAVQGNLAPEHLLLPREELKTEVRNICGSVPVGRHIFNLGHGVMQTTDPDAVGCLVDTVRKYDADV